MTRYFLHIGPHKTGTTAIQHFLSNNRDLLLAQGIDFPLIGRRQSGAQAHRYFSAYFRGISKEYPDTFEQEIAPGVTLAPVCILSSEDFYYCSTAPGVARAHAYLGDDVDVMCYLRDPISHIVSMHKEALKSGETVYLPDFMERHRSGIVDGKSFGYYRYDDNIAAWETRFRVQVLPYDRNTDIVEDFIGRCGIDAKGASADQDRQSNVALSDAASALLQSVNILKASGAMDEATRLSLKKTIAKHNDECAKLDDRLVRETISVKRFKKTFVRANPRHQKLAHRSPDEVKAVVGISMEPAQILDFLNGLNKPKKAKAAA